MSRYLDPKTDIVFKKIFGEHPALLKSFLNAVLPLPENGLIESLEYLSNEQVPVIPEFKFTIVDVKCTDQQGRTFIVEMQLDWLRNFKQRMLYNASHAYVKQLKQGQHYRLLKPVYALGLISDTFDSDDDHWYHHYKFSDTEKPVAIDEIQLIFIELPKFKAKTYRDKKLQVLWLRFMSELDEDTRQVPAELLAIPEIKQAIDLAEHAAYSPGELEAYDKYWDAFRVEKDRAIDSYEKGREEEREIQQKESHMKTVKIAQSLKQAGLSSQDIATHTGLSLEEIDKI